MRHPKKILHRPATEQDVAWFEPDNYKGLKDFTALEWARLVGDRLNIRRAIDGGDSQAIAGVFEVIKRDPLKWLGSDVRYIGAAHVANTATVKSMNYRRLTFISRELNVLPGFGGAAEGDDHACERRAMSPDAVIDSLLATNPESSFQRIAHVTVSLDYPRDLIIEDFTMWLERELEHRQLQDAGTINGDYMKKAENQWIPHCAVQWYDLDLFERLTGLTILSRWSKLFPREGYDALESKKRKAVNAAMLLFSEDTYRVLRRIADNR